MPERNDVEMDDNSLTDSGRGASEEGEHRCSPIEKHNGKKLSRHPIRHHIRHHIGTFHVSMERVMTIKWEMISRKTSYGI